MKYFRLIWMFHSALPTVTATQTHRWELINLNYCLNISTTAIPLQNSGDYDLLFLTGAK